MVPPLVGKSRLSRLGHHPLAAGRSQELSRRRTWQVWVLILSQPVYLEHVRPLSCVPDGPDYVLASVVYAALAAAAPRKPAALREWRPRGTHRLHATT